MIVSPAYIAVLMIRHSPFWVTDSANMVIEERKEDHDLCIK